MKLLDRLRRDHANLQRLLDLLSDELDAFFRGEESNFDLKTEMMDYLETYAERIHHPTEELIYNVALSQTDEGKLLLERLNREHVELLGMARRFRDTLEGIVQGEVISRDEVETRGREFIALERHHVDFEEQEIFPLLEQTLSEEQWADLAAEAPQGDDPLFMRQDRNRFASLIDYLKTKD